MNSTETILTMIAKDILLPEILMLVRAHIQAKGGDAGMVPTDDQVKAALPQDVLRVKSIGQAFLDMTRPQMTTPTTIPSAT